MPIYNFNQAIRMSEASAFSSRYTQQGFQASSNNFPSYSHPKESSFSDNHDGLFSQADLRADLDLSELVGLAKASAFSDERILYDVSFNIVKYVDVKMVPGEVYPIMLNRNFVLPDMFTGCDFDSKASILSIHFATAQCTDCFDHAPLDYQIEFPESNQVIDTGCSYFQATDTFSDSEKTGDDTIWQVMNGSGPYQIGYEPVVINGDTIVVCNLRTLTNYECNLRLRIKLRLSLPVKW